MIDERLFWVEKPLQLASGDEVSLVVQASNSITANRSTETCAHTFSPFLHENLNINVTAAHKSVFQEHFYSMCEESDEFQEIPEVYKTRLYGPWWATKPVFPTDRHLVPADRVYVMRQMMLDPRIYLSSRADPPHISDSLEFEFHQKVYPIGISVVDLWNTGSFIKISAKDGENQWHRLWSGRTKQALGGNRPVFSPMLRPCNFKTKVIKLESDNDDLSYRKVIPAIFLIGTSQLIAPNGEYQNPSFGIFQQPIKFTNHKTPDLSNLTPDLLAGALNMYLSKVQEILQIYCNCLFYKKKNVTNIGEDKLWLMPSSDILIDGNVSTQDSCAGFAVLTNEMLFNILKYLDVRSLNRCAQVNQRLRSVTRDPLLYKKLDLTPYISGMNIEVLKKLTTHCQYLRCLDISGYKSDGEQKNRREISYVFNHFLHACGSALIELQLTECDFVDDSVMQQISSVCINLKVLCFSSTFISGKGIESLTKLGTLERLEDNKSFVRCRSQTFRSLLQKNPRMRQFSMKNWLLNADKFARIIGDSCTNLEIIDCSWSSIGPRGITALARCTRLREVDFSRCANLSTRRGAAPNCLRVLFNSCSSLEKVNLLCIPDLSIEVLEPLLQCPIRIFNVGPSSSLTPDMFERFFLSWPELQIIKLVGCVNIRDFHIRDWQTRYPRVGIVR